MNRVIALALAACIAVAGLVAPRAARADDNPMLQVFKSTIYGGLAGLTVGGAIALVSEDDNGEPLKWGFVAGTFLGLGYGLYWVTSRSQPRAMLEVREGDVHLCAVPIVEVQDGTRVHLVGMRF